MKIVRLLSLRMSHFKGARDVLINFGGESASIYGTNETGKTTCADAVSWLLTGKDSKGAVPGTADFEIKTRAGGEALSGLDHSVEAELLVDGDVICLKKIYRELWKKRRGSADEKFSGHETACFVDGVPSTARAFTATVEDIVPTALLRDLSDPFEVADRMPWAARRKLLMGLIKSVDMGTVIAANSEISDLPDIIGNRSVEDHAKVTKAEIRKTSAERSALPSRIDEVLRGMPECPPESEAQMLRSKVRLAKQRSEAEAAKQRALVGSTADLDGELSKIRASIHLERCAIRERESQATGSYREQVKVLKRNKRESESAIADAQEKLSRTSKKVSDLDARTEVGRRLQERIDAEAFSEELPSDSCPACGQDLPLEEVAAARKRALEEFNVLKSRRLEDASKTVKNFSEASRSCREEMARIESFIEAESVKMDRFASDIATTEGKIAGISSTSQGLGLMLAKEDELVKNIAAIKADSTPEVEKFDSEIGRIEKENAGIMALLAQFDHRRKAFNRVEELKADESRLSGILERLERELHLCEEYTRSLVLMIDSRINERFNLARFRLFREQVNGGLDERCDVTDTNGVPFGSANHATQAALGLDIIKTLQHHCEISLPVFVDQAESFVTLPEMECQVIRLVVSEADESLRIETH